MTHDEALEIIRERAVRQDYLETPATRLTRALCVVLHQLATKDPFIPMTPHEAAARAEAWRRIEERGAEVERRISEYGC